MNLFDEAIARRRNEKGGLDWLSDWQVNSANMTASAIIIMAEGFETGPLYVPMPTGSGKTTGAIWGIIRFAKDFPDQRLCFMTLYKDSVDEVYKSLVEELGNDVVGHYHGDAAVDKDDELAKRIIVLTHQFIQYNQGALDDRDLFVVDEAIYATGEATLKLEHFNQARSWATSHNIYPDEFTKLANFANELDRQLQDSDKKYIAASRSGDLSWAQTIAFDLKLTDYSQTTAYRGVLVANQRFCEALLQGLVFLSRGNIDRDRYDPIYSAAVLGIPNLEKTIVLSATGGMVYDIAGSFKQDSQSKAYWAPPSYEQLKLVHLSGPDLPPYYDSWIGQDKKDKVVRYIDWVLSNVKEDTIYMTMPKKVLDGCLRDYLGQLTKGELEYPISVTKHGKQIKVSHHARSVGSNAFAECKAVVYLWDNHLPQDAAVRRFHTLANEEITDKALEEANKRRLVGNYERIREAQYIDNMMQQIGRGSTEHR
ncbi:DEAD/DEAH box helicase [Sulfitobacter sediminilitoris]|uniref:DEAD/DEAH box helicase n=1 Tax=Sulfitobacter sediminilitoris TaxID=2698830 RepID=UPI0036136D61